MNAFDEHPSEGGEEEVVKESGDGGADGAVVGSIEAEDEQDFGAQETDRKVSVDRGPVAS